MLIVVDCQRSCTIVEYETTNRAGKCVNFLGRKACKADIYIDLLGCVNQSIGHNCTVSSTVRIVDHGNCVSSDTTDYSEDYVIPVMVCIGTFGLILGLCE